MRTMKVQTTMERPITLPDDALGELARSFRGALIQPDDPDYDRARRVWNGMIDKHPALIARCSETADVAAAVNFARQHSLLLSVRGGGHNVAGRAVCDDGLVIDLSSMRGVRVDPANRTVQVQGGATLGDMDRETQPFGLAVPMGVVTATGIAGLTLHGGMGWLTRKYGLTIDNLISVEIVTADGRLRRASETEDPDLFWAVRGGGGNFGAVTSFEFRAYPVGPEVWFSVLVYPAAQARRVVRFAREFIAQAPEELMMLATFWMAPEEEFVPPEHRGTPAFIVLACYHGPVEQGEQVVRPLREAAELMAEHSGPRPFLDVQKFFDADYPNGMLYYWKSLYLDRLDDEVASILAAHAARRPSPMTSVDLWFLEGAMNRVPPDATAFARRDVHFGVAIESNWTDPAQSDANVAWSREVFDDMQKFSRGSYLNFPGFVEDREKLLHGAYGSNLDRLRAVKARYDPGNLFQGTLNIAPAR